MGWRFYASPHEPHAVVCDLEPEAGTCRPLDLHFELRFRSAQRCSCRNDDRFIYIIKRFVVTATDGTIVALKPSSDRAVGIWRPGSYLQIVADSKVNSIDVSPDGQLVVTGDDHNDAVVWDADTGSRIAVLPHTKPVTSVAFVRNGQAVVTGCRDGATRLWHSNGGPPIWIYPQRPWGEVYYGVVAPSDQLIASGGHSAPLPS